MPGEVLEKHKQSTILYLVSLNKAAVAKHLILIKKINLFTLNFNTTLLKDWMNSKLFSVVFDGYF